MHELSIAQNIIEIVNEHAKRHKAKQITRIVIDIGELSGVEKDALEFCFPIAAEGSVASDSCLELNIIPLMALCNACNHTFRVYDLQFICPECENVDLKIIDGKEMLIKTIDMTCEDEDE